jgi:hypothetical protein
VGVAKKRQKKRMKTKTPQPSGRPDTPATHGRDQLAPPKQAQVKPPNRMPGHGMR